MKIILLNGPPRCGKDHASIVLENHLQSNWTVRREKFSLPHKLAFAAMTRTNFNPHTLDAEDFADHKDEVLAWLGVSYRQWQIDFSEKFMKELYGTAIFASMFLQRCAVRRDDPKIITIVSDCGFEVEAKTVAKNFPASDVLLIRIISRECSFRGDSREWVFLPRGFTEVEITNENTPGFDHKLLTTVDRWLDGKLEANA